MKNIQIKTKNLRKIFDYQRGRVYTVVIPVDKLPDFDDWMKINPRGQNLNTSIAKAISKTLIDDPSLFVLKNRGLTLMVENVEYNNKSEILSFHLSDDEIHGLLDGGHTYKSIKEYNKLLEDLDNKENISDIPDVKIELIEGDLLSDDERVDTVKARNFSTQVKDDSLANLKDYFGKIQKEIENEKYAECISYKENDLTEENNKKPIPVSEILSYMKCFDIEKFDRQEQPIEAYSGKGTILKRFANSPEEREKIEKLIPRLRKILEIRDKIYYNLHDFYDGHLGRAPGVMVANSNAEGARKRKPTKLYFLDKESDYRIPSGYIYPFLASFRANLDEKMEWKVDPDILFDHIGKPIGANIAKEAKKLKNPNQLGKDKSLWQLCYQEVLFTIDDLKKLNH